MTVRVCTTVSAVPTWNAFPRERCRGGAWNPLTKRVTRKIGMQQIKQSVAITVSVLMRDRITGFGLAGLTLTVNAKKIGSAFGAITPTGVTDRGNGWYDIGLSTSHTDTLGSLVFHITGVINGQTCEPNDDLQLEVVAYNPYDAMLGRFPSGSVVSDAGNGVLTFKTDLTQTVTDYWNGAFIVLTSGVMIGQVHKVSGYDGSTKFITISTGFTGTPAAGVTFYLINS